MLHLGRTLLSDKQNLDHVARGQNEKMPILTITNNPCKEFQLDYEEIVSNDFPLKTLGLALDSLIHLWWRNFRLMLMHGLPVRDQLRAYGRHSSDLQMISRHGLQTI